MNEDLNEFIASQEEFKAIKAYGENLEKGILHEKIASVVSRVEQKNIHTQNQLASIDTNEIEHYEETDIVYVYKHVEEAVRAKIRKLSEKARKHLASKITNIIIKNNFCNEKGFREVNKNFCDSCHLMSKKMMDTEKKHNLSEESKLDIARFLEMANDESTSIVQKFVDPCFISYFEKFWGLCCEHGMSDEVGKLKKIQKKIKTEVIENVKTELKKNFDKDDIDRKIVKISIDHMLSINAFEMNPIDLSVRNKEEYRGFITVVRNIKKYVGHEDIFSKEEKELIISILRLDIKPNGLYGFISMDGMRARIEALANCLINLNYKKLDKNTVSDANELGISLLEKHSKLFAALEEYRESLKADEKISDDLTKNTSSTIATITTTTDTVGTATKRTSRKYSLFKARSLAHLKRPIKEKEEEAAAKNKSPRETETEKSKSPRKIEDAKSLSPRKPEDTKDKSPRTEITKSRSPRETEATKSRSPRETEATKSRSPRETEATKSRSPRETEATKSRSPRETEAPKSRSPRETEGAKKASPRSKGRFSFMRKSNEDDNLGKEFENIEEKIVEVEKISETVECLKGELEIAFQSYPVKNGLKVLLESEAFNAFNNAMSQIKIDDLGIWQKQALINVKLKPEDFLANPEELFKKVFSKKFKESLLNVLKTPQGKKEKTEVTSAFNNLRNEALKIFGGVSARAHEEVEAAVELIEKTSRSLPSQNLSISTVKNQNNSVVTTTTSTALSVATATTDVTFTTKTPIVSSATAKTTANAFQVSDSFQEKEEEFNKILDEFNKNVNHFLSKPALGAFKTCLSDVFEHHENESSFGLFSDNLDEALDYIQLNDESFKTNSRKCFIRIFSHEFKEKFEIVLNAIENEEDKKRIKNCFSQLQFLLLNTAGLDDGKLGFIEKTVESLSPAYLEKINNMDVTTATTVITATTITVRNNAAISTVQASTSPSVFGGAMDFFGSAGSPRKGGDEKANLEKNQEVERNKPKDHRRLFNFKFREKSRRMDDGEEKVEETKKEEQTGNSLTPSGAGAT